jgi:hypothetical protein
MTTDGPTVTNVKRLAGIAGQYGFRATVQYPGEAPKTITFVGSVHGMPIVMTNEDTGSSIFVSHAVTDRIGSTLDAGWVARFFGGAE